jgi:hypothetical protein
MLTAIDNFIFYLLFYVSIVLPFQLQFTSWYKEKKRRQRSRARDAARDRLRQSLYRDVMGYECQLSASQLSNWIGENNLWKREQEDWNAIQHRYPE